MRLADPACRESASVVGARRAPPLPRPLPIPSFEPGADLEVHALVELLLRAPATSDVADTVEALDDILGLDRDGAIDLPPSLTGLLLQLSEALTAPAARNGDRPPDFAVARERLGDSCYLVAIAGEVDLFTAPAVDRELEGVIAAGARTVIVDLGAATFIDSTFLGVLLHGLNLLRRTGGELGVVCSDPSLRSVFEATGLDSLLTIRPGPQWGA